MKNYLDVLSTYSVNKNRSLVYSQSLSNLYQIYDGKKYGIFVDYSILNNLLSSLDHVDTIISKSYSLTHITSTEDFDVIFVFVNGDFNKEEYDLKIFSTIKYINVQIIYITESKNDHSHYSLL